ncbi:hypothetical protein ABIE13_005552 [Ottowia thiooxydans]|uniref:Uncharacterized protein n=1 Tax=Ottowia thiooxydans TaxID=219182 RepID=A0ABV2QH93_9BURK
MRELLVQVAQPIGLKPPRHHISLRLLKLLLRVPFVARVLNTNAEALDFIQTTRFNTAALEQFANRHGIAKPDIRQSLQHTATFVNSYCIANGRAR